MVIGKRGEGSAGAFEHMGSNLERIIRSATVPVLVAAREFHPITSVLIAYDGSASADRAVERMAQSTVFGGLAAELAYAGADTVWTCRGFVPVRFSCYAALRSKATGLFQPNAECRRRRL